MNDGKFSEKSDEKLMQLYQEGDEKALEELYRRYSGRVYAYLKKRLSDKDWADDVFQQVFTKLHQTRHQYNSEYRFDQWIFVMTKTILLDFWKTTDVKTKRFFSESIENIPETIVSEQLATQQIGLYTGQQPGEQVHQQLGEQAPQLSGALATAALSPDQRSAIELKFIDELSYQEIANKLGRSEESVRQLVSRAIRKVRKQFTSSGGKV